MLAQGPQGGEIEGQGGGHADAKACRDGVSEVHCSQRVQPSLHSIHKWLASNCVKPVRKGDFAEAYGAPVGACMLLMLCGFSCAGSNCWCLSWS